MYNLPRLGDPLKVSETKDQEFVVVPALAVSVRQKIFDMDDIPQQGVLLEVLETNGLAFLVVPTLYVSTNKKHITETYLVSMISWC